MKRIIFLFFIVFLFFSFIDCYSDERFLYEGLLYKDIIGKIYIPHTNINTYILKTVNNSYYLNHSYDGSDSKFGSVFLDFRNHYNDRKLLIYGHNSKYEENALFRDLEKYKSKDFYDENKYLYLTLGNDSYKYLIFSVHIVSNEDNLHTRLKYNTMEFYRYLLDVKKHSLYDTSVSLSEDDFIVTLQTCNYEPQNTYLLLYAKRVDE